MSVGLAILNLILGVVVDVASQARGSLQSELELEALVAKQELQFKLLETCKEMDTDGNGQIDKEEMERGYEMNEAFRESLHGIGISLEELDILWTLLDTDKSGTVTYSEFVAECYKMKTSQTDFMLAYIKYYVTLIKSEIIEEITLVKQELKLEDEKIEMVGKEMLAQERLIGESMTEIGVVERDIEKHEMAIESKVMGIEADFSSGLIAQSSVETTGKDGGDKAT